MQEQSILYDLNGFPVKVILEKERSKNLKATKKDKGKIKRKSRIYQEKIDEKTEMKGYLDNGRNGGHKKRLIKDFFGQRKNNRSFRNPTIHYVRANAAAKVAYTLGANFQQFRPF